MKIHAILRRTASALVLVPLIAAADQAQTRDLRNDPDAPIVVTGQRLTREQARERAVTFVRQVGVARGDISAARFVDPVCPRVMGIAEPYAGMVRTRMLAIAQAAGIAVGREGCQSNISVSFVGDASALMREIDRRSPTRFNEVPRDERAAMLNGDAPIRWWYLTETRSRYSMRNAPQSMQTETGGQTGGSAVTSGALEADALSHYDAGSHVSNQVNRAIVDANVVIDLDGVEGRSLQAVAAYAAFVAFSEVRPSEPPPTGSILGMFGAEPQADALTDWDMAFLRALYNLPLDRQARRHRGMLVRDMVDFQTRG
ncbi:hypothetical protein [Sphingosinicella sp.]|uniref:hypothetical protein n=1 Tax=Sphingosinicella sp. TaxID=1917971 RepID=UPI004037F49C